MSNYEDQREALYEAGQLQALHRPLEGDGMFKGGLQQPEADTPARTAPVYGWICAKCGSGNRPTNAICAHCSRTRT